MIRKSYVFFDFQWMGERKSKRRFTFLSGYFTEQKMTECGDHKSISYAMVTMNHQIMLAILITSPE